MLFLSDKTKYAYKSRDWALEKVLLFCVARGWCFIKRGRCLVILSVTVVDKRKGEKVIERAA